MNEVLGTVTKPFHGKSESDQTHKKGSTIVWCGKSRGQLKEVQSLSVLLTFLSFCFIEQLLCFGAEGGSVWGGDEWQPTLIKTRMSHNEVCWKAKGVTGAAFSSYYYSSCSQIFQPTLALYFISRPLHVLCNVCYCMWWFSNMCLTNMLSWCTSTDPFLKMYIFLHIKLYWHTIVWGFVFICCISIQNNCIHSAPPRQWHISLVKKKNKTSVLTLRIIWSYKKTEIKE